MKTLYFECNMGAAGDMLMAALLELHDDPANFLARLNAAGIPGVCISAAPAEKCGIFGTHISVSVNGMEEHSEDVREHDYDYGYGYGHGPSREDGHSHSDGHLHGHEHEGGHSHGHGHEHSAAGHSHSGGHLHGHEHEHSAAGHSHSGLHDIEHIIIHLRVSDDVKRNALAVYGLIAEAESHAHGVPVSDVHFHEVGTMDAVADIVGVCMLMEELAPDMVLASPIHVGSGQVRCSHGVLPVPAPATARILRGVPVYGGGVRGELCTPTGAALLKHFVQKFDTMPLITVLNIGYGMGKKDFENANCVRAFLGDMDECAEQVTELACNLDDMTPEAVAFVQQLLLERGALDVYTACIGMKKGRMGILLTCLCRSEQKDEMVSLLFKHTSTLGMRETCSRRYTLQREQSQIQTQYGVVRVKTASGYGVTKAKPEYEDIAKMARENDLSLGEVITALWPFA